MRVRTSVNDRHARRKAFAHAWAARTIQCRAGASAIVTIRSTSEGAGGGSGGIRAGNKRSELIVRRISSFPGRHNLAVQCRNRRRRRRRRRWRQCGVRNQKSDGDLNGFRVAGPIPCLVEWIGGSSIVPASARIRFHDGASLFYEGVKRGSCPSHSARRRAGRFAGKTVLEIHKNPRDTHYFRSPARSPRPKCSRPLCQLVTWVPWMRKKRAKALLFPSLISLLG